MLPDLHADPFGENTSMQFSQRMRLLGGDFHFDSNCRDAMRLVDSAYAGLPRHRLTPGIPRFHVRLFSPPALRHRGRHEPPPLAMLAGGSLLGGATARSSFVALNPRGQGAVVVLAPDMLRHAYHARYEMLEFAVFTLAARSQGLVALHGACVGRNGRGLLLLGPSGAGKSTIALHALLRGMEFLSEDSVFVVPHTLLATGIANFLHIRADSLRWIRGSATALLIRASPVIRRRSGERKFEVDLRSGGHRLAPAALEIEGVVFLSPQPAGDRPLLTRIGADDFHARLRAEQAYAVNQPPWPPFLRAIMQVGAFEMRRAAHPHEAAQALDALLAGK